MSGKGNVTDDTLDLPVEMPHAVVVVLLRINAGSQPYGYIVQHWWVRVYNDAKKGTLMFTSFFYRFEKDIFFLLNYNKKQ